MMERKRLVAAGAAALVLVVGVVAVGVLAGGGDDKTAPVRPAATGSASTVAPTAKPSDQASLSLPSTFDPLTYAAAVAKVLLAVNYRDLDQDDYLAVLEKQMARADELGEPADAWLAANQLEFYSGNWDMMRDVNQVESLKADRVYETAAGKAWVASAQADFEAQLVTVEGRKTVEYDANDGDRVSETFDQDVTLLVACAKNEPCVYLGPHEEVLTDDD